MILYKFKSLQNKEHIKDILSEQRFYASSFLDLNDPMEGYFEYFKTEYGPENIKSLEGEKGKHLICSFSKVSDHMLMWAFYANQFKGICIELDLNENGNGNYEIAKVEYRDRRTQLDELKDLDINEKAKYLLRHKIKIWKYCIASVGIGHFLKFS